MPDLNSVPPSPRHLFQDPAPRSGILEMPPPPLPSSSSSSNLLSSSTSRATTSRQSVDPARQGNRHTSSRGAPSPTGAFATMTGQSPSREPTDRADYFTLRGTAQGSRPVPLLSRENSIAGGPGPSRHPRPMTAAELHSELEQEQEAMVNFLSRELQSLRDANNASVVSNSSSTSTSVSAPGTGTEPANPSARRASIGGHRRTYSNASSSAANVPARPSIHTLTGSGISSPAPSRNPASVSSTSSSGYHGVTPSNTSQGSTVCNNPGPYTISPPNSGEAFRAAPPYMQGRYTGPSPLVTMTGGTPPPLNSPVGPYSLSRSDSRHSLSSVSTTTTSHHYPRFPTSSLAAAASSSSAVATPSSFSSEPLPSPALLPATSRYEETAFYRREYETIKLENEALKQQVREMERRLRQRRASNGVPEEEVRVGESAASAGVTGREACD